jgi:hypothetical protein
VSPTFVVNKMAIKDCKIVLKGFLDKADTGQAALWTEYTAGAGTLICKVTFDEAGSHFIWGPMTVDSIAIGEQVANMVTVTYNLSQNGIPTVA